MLGHLNLHQGVRRVGGRAAACRQLELGHQLLLAHAEPARSVGDRSLPDLGQPADHGQQPAQSPTGLGPGRGAYRCGGPIVLTGDRRRHADVRRERRRRCDERGEPCHQFLAEGGGLDDRRVVEESEHPGADGDERGHLERELDRSIVEAVHDLVLTHLVGHPAGLQRVDPDPHLHPVLPARLPGLVGQGRLHVHVLGHLRASGLAAGHLAVDPVHPERAHGATFEVPGHQIPMSEAEPEAHGGDTACLGPVGVRSGGPRPHRFEELDERRRRHHRRDGAHVAEACRAQLQQRIPPTRIAEVDAGDGEVESDLLVGLEVQFGQIERLAVDLIPVLLVARQPLREDGDPLVAQQPLVSLEGLTPRRVLSRVPRDLMRDGVERQGLLSVEEHEHEVRDAFQPVELRGCLHRPEPTAVAAA